MENNKTGKEVQGTVTQERKEKKSQAVSVTYTLESQKNNITKLWESGIIAEEELPKWKELHEKAIQAYVKKTFGM